MANEATKSSLTDKLTLKPADTVTEDAKVAADKVQQNKEAQEKIAKGEKQANETEVIVTDETDVPDNQKTGRVAPSLGADDQRPNNSDTAAESSTLTKNAMDATFGRGPSPQDRLPSDVADRSISGAASATGDSDNAKVRFFYTDFHGMSFRAGPKGDNRVTFDGRVLVTADEEAIKYIEENFLDKGTRFRITEISEDEYRERRSHGDVVATHTTMFDPRDKDKVVLQPRTAVTARKPRTDADPRVQGLPETGNAQQDHFTQGEKLIAEERPGTSTGNVQLQRNKAELDAVAGKGVASDSKANPPPPAAQTGMVNSLTMQPQGASKK